MQIEKYCVTEQDTENFAASLALACKTSGKTWGIHLVGELGAGKTCFSRGFIWALGHTGSVKSPTYTLVEPYDIGEWRLFHFDLYRLADPEELEFMGFRDYLDQQVINLIEWPSKGEGSLPSPDLKINIEFAEPGRNIKVEALTGQAQDLLEKLK